MFSLFVAVRFFFSVSLIGICCQASAQQWSDGFLKGKSSRRDRIETPESGHGT